jgi:hypothetical protein
MGSSWTASSSENCRQRRNFFFPLQVMFQRVLPLITSLPSCCWHCICYWLCKDWQWMEYRLHLSKLATDCEDLQSEENSGFAFAYFEWHAATRVKQFWHLQGLAQHLDVHHFMSNGFSLTFKVIWLGNLDNIEQWHHSFLYASRSKSNCTYTF